MSMQQSEAHQDQMRKFMADEAPPPSAGAVRRFATSHQAADRRRIAAQRRAEEIAEAAALGVEIITKITLDRKWTAAEDAVVRALYPHYAQMHKKLPQRSINALHKRAGDLDIRPARKLWTAPEVAALQRIWVKATTKELLAEIPRWNARSIDNKARDLGLKPRGQPPLFLTGNTLCDEIRDRCRTLGYSMFYLDRISHTGTYFSGREWKLKSGHRTTPMIRAVTALGGKLNVEWPD